MLEQIPAVFDTETFMPHGHCYLWRPALLWLQVLSNGLIGVSYVVIAITLTYLVKKGDFLPFRGMALAFGAFIITCGITHFMDVVVIWEPAYWIDGGIRAITAAASVGTALLLPPLVPRAVALARGAKAARARGVELEAAVEGLGQLVEKTRELDELKTEFFANVSHELRTPLALILGPAEKLVHADNLTEAQRRDAEVITRNARTLLKHVNDLLDVSRLEAGRLEVSYKRFDICEKVRLVAAHFDGLATERNTSYLVDAAETMLIEGDPDKLARVILNLLSNAFKFTGTGGTVRCTVRTGESDRVVIEVADDGPGVAPDKRDAVFERFRQADGGSTRQFGGTGLGLAIARDFVELHRGSIEVDDAPEGGALFRIVLPTRAPDGVVVEDGYREPTDVEHVAVAHQALDELRARSQAADSYQPVGAPLVLVVEDNPDMNRFVCEALETDYRTRSALDGKEGLELAVQLRPDLIVSDIMMPKLSGDQLVAQLRGRSEFDHTPILLLSAKADDDLRVELLRDGAQDYVTKPFATDELKARVRNLVEMKRARDVLQREIEAQVSDLETLATQVTQRQRELRDALDAMRVARDQAERASQLKGNFLSVVSHELRTPLATLKIQLERLRLEREAHESAGSQTIVDRMTASATRLDELIASILQYARLEAGKAVIEIQPVDLGPLAAEVVEQIRPQAEAKGIELRVEPATDAAPLHTDARLARLIISNLVSNAVRHTDGGSVRISLGREGEYYRIAVKDTGPGIAKADQARIFEPFEQVGDARKKHTEGIGLGLALVREMVSTLRGKIELQSAMGEGATFIVRLPSLEETPEK